MVVKNWPKVETEAVLAIGAFFVFAAALWAVIFNTMPAENEKYVMLMLGALIGLVKDTFGRYFQATKGAQELRKDAAQVTQALAVAAATPTVTATGDSPVINADTPAPQEPLSWPPKD